jgi:catechol 2,3-dioxygenase-like lactoylglutathione lyase family enzyme
MSNDMEPSVELGHFSISLAVKDLERSHAFYKTLGFRRIDGDPAQNWLILKNGDAKIGLFAGMFEGNLVTFNPPDARSVQALVTAAGYALEKPTEAGEGPTHFVVRDPDGNTILVDQHASTPSA